MYWKDIGYLLKESNEEDELHRVKRVYNKEKVFCNIKSIGQSEFYQAQTSGLKPEIKVELKCLSIDNSVTHFEFNEKIYKILRIYKLQDKIELTLTSLVIDSE